MPEASGRYAETALDPDLPLVDAHHHLYPEGSEEGYGRRDLHRDLTAGHNFVATVFVDCSAAYRQTGPAALAPVGETEWALEQRSDEDHAFAAMVSHADMYLGSGAGAVLDAHLEVGPEIFRGIRHAVAWDRHPAVNNALRDAPEHALLDETFQAGVAELARRDLIFETWIYFHQVGELAQLAGRFPDLQVVLDHLAGPVVIGPYAGHRAEMLESWREAIKLLVPHQNVALKLGGIGYKSFVEQSVLDGPRTSQWLAEYWEPEVLFCIETLGPERCMFESNFPVDNLLCDYVTIWNVFKRIAANLSTDERSAVFEQTARRVYRF